MLLRRYVIIFCNTCLFYPYVFGLCQAAHCTLVMVKWSSVMHKECWFCTCPHSLSIILCVISSSCVSYQCLLGLGPSLLLVHTKQHLEDTYESFLHSLLFYLFELGIWLEKLHKSMQSDRLELYFSFGIIFSVFRFRHLILCFKFVVFWMSLCYPVSMLT